MTMFYEGFNNYCTTVSEKTASFALCENTSPVTNINKHSKQYCVYVFSLLTETSVQ